MENMGGWAVMVNQPRLGLKPMTIYSRDLDSTYLVYFHTLVHSFALAKTQLFCFQATLNSLAKTPGGGGTLAVSPEPFGVAAVLLRDLLKEGVSLPHLRGQGVSARRFRK